MMGLYAIVNTINNKAYVGSSTNFKRRFKDHLVDLRKNKHHCSYLQNAWNKYGEGSFRFKVLVKVDTHVEAKEIEQAFLDCFYNNNLYNTKNTSVGFSSGESHPSKLSNWHMKTVKERLTEEERKEKYGKCKGITRDPAPYVLAAQKRISDPTFSERLSSACKGKRKIVECPTCGLKGGGGNMRRYHFDKCKDKK